jgi:hypothetical protein
MSTTPANHGKPWFDNEILQLLQAVRRKETHEQIASTHQRTIGGIRSRLRELAADYHFNENRPIEQIMKFTGLDEKTIVDAISRRESARDKREKKSLESSVSEEKVQPEIKREGMISLLVEIRDMMKEVLEIMREKKV